jgi:hypothetical protein
MKTHLKYLIENNRIKFINILNEDDDHPRAPVGGIKIKGKFFPGGRFIPKDYVKDFKKMQKNVKSKQTKEKPKEKSTEKKQNIITFEKSENIRKSFDVSKVKENKHNVVTKLSKKMKVSYKTINNMIHNWAETSADESLESLGLQYVAKDVFGVGKTSHFGWDINKTKRGKVKENFVKEIYAETQEWFKKQGLKPDDKVKLYRGVINEITSGKYALQPLSSFSFVKSVAKEFSSNSGTVFYINVPVKNIFSTPLTGIGCTGEFEAVVIGHDIDINIISVKKIKDKSDFKKIGKDDDIFVTKKMSSLIGSPKKVNGDYVCESNTKLKSLEGAPKEVGGNFICFETKITSLRGSPVHVGGDFECSYNHKLKDLTGAPLTVGGDFDCSSCPVLESLFGSPKKINGSYNCDSTNITSLKGGPEEVGGSFNCSDTNITSLEDGPKIVKGDYSCSYIDNLKSLKGAPKEVGGDFDCSGNENLKSLKGCPKVVNGDFYCDDIFTEKEIRKICKVKGKVIRQ